MISSLSGKFCMAAAASVILSCFSSCVEINESLGEDFIPTDQIWEVHRCDAVALEDGITMERSDSLSGYSTSRFTFGAVKSGDFTTFKGTSFTLVPLADKLDFGEGEPEILRFRFTAALDTLSAPYGKSHRILQNVRVYALNEALDSNVLYCGESLTDYIDMSENITVGVPVYDGGDSLSFDFSRKYAEQVIAGIRDFQSLSSESRDTIGKYIERIPGIYICTDEQTTDGGRINMFRLPIDAESGYITGNYAELTIRAKYPDSDERKDTSFVFYFGPSRFLQDDDTSYPTQFAFNTSINGTTDPDFLANWKSGTKEKLYVEGGSGFKPVVKAEKIREILESLMAEHGINNPEKVAINKATIILPYDVNGDYEELDHYPMILSPTVKLQSKEKYVTYAGLTDSSIESENQGGIDRSRFMYCPDISHHVQEILRLKKGSGENVPADETDEAFRERLKKYDIWFLIMHDETVTSSSGSSGYDDYYNNLLYNSYYNNMMYDPYGYGYGYGYGGYGYGGYGYDYNNYYNYYMMAAYASASSGSAVSTSLELDKDRFYNAVLNGPGYGTADETDKKPRLKVTFSVPKTAEN